MVEGIKIEFSEIEVGDFIQIKTHTGTTVFSGVIKKAREISDGKPVDVISLPMTKEYCFDFKESDIKEILLFQKDGLRLFQ